MSQNSLKINFVLDKALARLFDDYAATKGVSKAELIRSWVKDSLSNIRISSLEHLDESTSFSFMLDGDTFDQVSEQSEKYGLSKGAYLRLLIQSKLSVGQNTAEQWSMSQQLWKTGRLKDLIALLESGTTDLKLPDLELLASAYIGLGKFSNAESVIVKIEDANVSGGHNNLVYSRLLSLKAEMARYRLDTNLSKFYLESAIKIALTNYDRGLLGKIYYQLGMLSYMADNTNEALISFLKALEYLDIKNHAILISVVYLYLARLHEQELNYALSEQYFSRAEDILLSMDNAYYLGWVYNALGMSKAIQGKMLEAIGFVNKSLKYNQISGSDMETHYSYKYLGLLNLATNNFDQSYDFFNKAEDKEKIFRPGVVNSRNQLMKLIIESKSDYNAAIGRMEELISPHRGQVKPALGKYLLGTAKYVNGESQSDQRKGRDILENLSKNSKGLMKDAATNTLETKKIQVIR